MFSTTLKLMKKSARTLIPAGIAILIGTAFIAATFLFGNAMDGALRTQLTAQYAGADYVAQMTGAYSDGNAEPTTIDDMHLNQVRGVDGVDGTHVVINEEGKVGKGTQSTATLFGLGTGDEKLQSVRVTAGRLPDDGADETAIPEALATKIHARLGQRITVSSSDSGKSLATTAKLVGLTHDDTGAYAVYDGLTLVSEPVLAKVMGLRSAGQVTAITLLVDVDQAKAGQALPQIKRILGHRFSVDTRQHIADESMKDMSAGGTTPVKAFLMAFGILAMLVAALVIANTFQVMVAQRRRTLALLRTIGAKKGQLYRSVLFEAGVLGLVSSALGILAAVGLMALMGATKTGTLNGQPMGVTLTWPTVVVPLAFGVVMTVLASLSSARSATRVTPLEALRPIEASDNRKAGVARAAIGVLMLVAGLALCVFGATRMPVVLAHPVHDGSSTLYAVALLAAVGGCALVFVALALTAVFWMPVLMRGVGALVAHIGPSAKIADANIQKNPRRVAATGVALLIGVTLVSTIATGAASAKQTMNATLDAHYSVDVVARGDGLTADRARKVAKVDGVSHSLYLPTASARLDTDGNAGGNANGNANGRKASALLVGVPSRQALQKVMRADISGVAIDGEHALAPKLDANGKKITALGGQATFSAASQDGSGRRVTLPLKTTQVDYRQLTGAYSMVVFVDQSRLDAAQVKTDGHILLASLSTSSSSLGETFEQVQAALGDGQGVDISGPVAQRVQWNTLVDRMMQLLVGLLAVAVLIALIGVANTLSLSVIERTRESATLRAIGMTRRQLKRSLACESLLISLVSGVAGVVLGTGFGWLGSYMYCSLIGDPVYLFDWRFNGAVLLVAAVAALLASVLPARRAVRTPPVAALAEA
ncbi:FtsX-like permease family protein [Bifidobacterium sp. ESL0763]|uniref:ABC transporter permease n=1 Tax=Bifidobacterium sp. ESL0763 TaxID=2983227 RepID=UPI0023FA18D9|nr:FtsX-like permease family protein [Bifidobacterium sp. ESL0763]MDF7664026.1 FtsX-like permease family protein [Bifidobacterium sp. ESL0763]